MAAPQRIVSVNLGSQTVGLAEFRTQPHGGLVLVGYRLRELLSDPGNEGARNAEISAGLAELMRELKLPGSAVNYSVAAQSVFARFVKLPAVEEEKIERIIQFEAQQNVPFPIEEVVWDYQLVGSALDEQLQVVLVAIKSDLLEGINAAVEGADLQAQTVDLATMALYNAFRYNYSDLSDCSLLIDLGARTTNLLFIEPGRIFSRSIPIAGGSITAALAKEFAEPLGAAEYRKKRDGSVSLGGAYAEPEDQEIARVSKIVRSTLTRLHAELMRSISHYRAQQQGAAPTRIFLCGGTAGMPYMREFFQEKLQLPVELFHPLRNVAVGEAVATEQVAHDAHLLGELVGLALRTATTCPMELNLRPATVLRRQEIERRRPFFMVAAACFLLGLFGWGCYYARAASVERKAAERLAEKVDGMRRISTQLDGVRKQVAALDHVALPVAAAVNDRSFWPEIIEELNARLPKENIWITELIATSGGNPIGVGDLRNGRADATPAPTATPTPTPTLAPAKPAGPGGSPKAPPEPAIDGLLVRGLYLFNPKQQEVVVDYFRNLVGSPFFNIDPNNQAKVIRPTTPNNTEWAFPYELRLELKKPVTLP
ncbi:MAG: type IV pilus assembly protein PilM [Verrucomicrobiota bacterium]|nr:type IV pilus assembly protein PilM [Verrucomicrobiota bacterium]